jgi:outer membrane protein, heavy metal efflux system
MWIDKMVTTKVAPAGPTFCRAVRILAVLGVLAATSSPNAQAQEHRSNRDPSLTLAQAVDAAVARSPRAPIPGASAAEAEAWRRRSETWLGAAPSGFGSYRSDQLNGDRGFYEAEAGMTLPIWKSGQRESAAQIAAAAGTEAEVGARFLRLEVAGLVREALWDALFAENRIDAAQEALDAVQKLAESVEKRIAHGDLPRADRLLVEAEVKGRKAALVTAEAAFDNAMQRYRVLTGLKLLPRRPFETQSTITALPEDHPSLALLAARASREAGQVAWLRSSGVSNPSVTVSVRNDRSDRFSSSNNSLLFGVSVPFGSGVYAAPGIAERGRSSVEAEVAREQAARELALALEQARRRVSAGETTVALAREQADLAREHYQVNEKAFAAGEIDLFTLIRLQNQAQAAQVAARDGSIQLNRDIALYNQLVGVLP